MSNHQPNNFSLEDSDNENNNQNQNQQSPRDNNRNPSPRDNNNQNNQQQQQRDPNDIRDDDDDNDPNNVREDGKSNAQEDNQAPAQPQPNEENKEEKKDAKAEKEMAKTSNFINKNLFVSQQRSNLMTMNDRHQLEQDVMKQIQSGSGIFGTSKINLDERKKKIFKVDANKTLPQNDALVKLMQSDGLFVDSALLFKNKDINVQKLEERLLNNGQKEYFRLNGQIKVNNDILADELTRPADLAFEQTDAFQTIENNAIVTDRLNSFKKQYYRIDIIVGKIVMK